jgi:ABC-type multidrug transport system ATPase subunit
MQIIAQGVSKTYGSFTALQNVSFTIETGITALLGPNGAGKTTLLNMLATLLTPSAGRLTIGGLDTQRQRREVRQRLGYLPQEFGVYGALNAYEFLDYFAQLRGLHSNRERAERVLAHVGLEQAAKRRVGGYSGGMRRRLGIAQALLSDPPVLIVDEPTAGLDPEERIRFRQLLMVLGAERTVLLSTHLVEDVALSAERVIVLDRGQKRFDGSLKNLTDSVAGRVWAVPTTAQTLVDLQAQHKVTRLTPNPEGGMIAHILADQVPSGQAQPAPHTLEDAYLNLLR